VAITVTANETRLWRDLMTMSRIGRLPGGGAARIALSDADRDGRSLFIHWCEEAGLAVSVDAIGNIFARREGTDPSLPAVLLGSHLDTQAPGGHFDGVLGVLGALEVIRALDDAGVKTRHPIVIVNWTDEEAVRYWPGMLGSSVFCGFMTLEQAYAVRGPDGTTVGAELSRIGFVGPRPAEFFQIHCHFELHIEQGTRLEEAGRTIGVVTHTNCTRFAAVEFRGENGQAATTPMRRRRNALAGAGRLIAVIERVGASEGEEGSASAVKIDVEPNNHVNLPNRALVWYIVNHPERAAFDRMVQMIESEARSIAAEQSLQVETVSEWRSDPLHFPSWTVGTLEEAASDLGLPAKRLHSIGAHDAMVVAKRAPTGMIFVPCLDGISHNEREYCSPEHAAAGASVLATAALRAAIPA
jgi:N-carbamoyl-L-amino-acid hydrolase